MNEIDKTDRLISVLSQQELEFERGVWSAAMDGEEGKVRRRLAEGTSPNATDSAGYTPLVSEEQLLDAFSEASDIFNLIEFTWDYELMMG